MSRKEFCFVNHREPNSLFLPSKQWERNKLCRFYCVGDVVVEYVAVVGVEVGDVIVLGVIVAGRGSWCGGNIGCGS